MTKTILVTGATDGIGFATAKALVQLGHTVLLHGRNPKKLEAVEAELTALEKAGHLQCYVADLSRMEEVERLAQSVATRHQSLDVLVNNAGVYNAPNAKTDDGLDIRFAVNSFAPYLLTRRLWDELNSAPSGRVINVSSAAQSSVQIDALLGRIALSDGAAYAQSKLALTMWSHELALSSQDAGAAIIAVNPGSMLGSKMVKEAFGVTSGDVAQGAEILVRAALSDDFAAANGQYFDNDSGQFALPHPDALDRQKSKDVVDAMETWFAA